MNFKPKLQWCLSLHLALCCVEMLPAAQQKCPIESRKRQVNVWRSGHFVQQTRRLEALTWDALVDEWVHTVTGYTWKIQI